MFNFVFISIFIIFISIILMAKIKKFDKKSRQNRERVRKYREKKKFRSIYKKLVEARKKSEKNDEENPMCEAEIENNELNNDQIFLEKLKNWAINNRISATAINELLILLRFGGFNFLPKDSRTLKQTPKNLEIKELTNGRMWYNGVCNCLKNFHMNNISKITLDWNFDGLPVFKSSNLQFWPMLASIQGVFFDIILAKSSSKK